MFGIALTVLLCHGRGSLSRGHGLPVCRIDHTGNSPGVAIRESLAGGPGDADHRATPRSDLTVSDLLAPVGVLLAVLVLTGRLRHLIPGKKPVRRSS